MATEALTMLEITRSRNVRNDGALAGVVNRYPCLGNDPGIFDWAPRLVHGMRLSTQRAISIIEQ